MPSTFSFIVYVYVCLCVVSECVLFNLLIIFETIHVCPYLF